MRQVTFGLIVLAMGLGLAVLARESDAPQEQDEGYPAGASRELMAEHEVILRVVAAAQAQAEEIQKGFSLDKQPVRDMLDFFRNFGDKCHHAKEERYYFPAVQVHAGQRVFGLIDELEAEHAHGRAILEEIDYLLRETDRTMAKIIAERLATYAGLLRNHIRKEDEQLYRKAGAVLPSEEERALTIAFERHEVVELGPDFHRRYENYVRELSGRLRLRE